MMSIPRRYIRSNHPDVLSLFDSFTQEAQETRDAFFAAWPDITGIEGKDESYCWVVVLKDENASPSYLRSKGFAWISGKKVATMRPNKRTPEGGMLAAAIERFSDAMQATPYHRLAKHLSIPTFAWAADRNSVGRLGANKTDAGVWLSLPFSKASDAGSFVLPDGWVDVHGWEFDGTFEKAEAAE
jgi:hypothetical protein